MSDEDTHEAKVFYAKFPPDIQKRKVLLMYPIMCKDFRSFVFAHLLFAEQTIARDENVYRFGCSFDWLMT